MKKYEIDALCYLIEEAEDHYWNDICIFNNNKLFSKDVCEYCNHICPNECKVCANKNLVCLTRNLINKSIKYLQTKKVK